jgi:hypothetical protein
MAKREVDGAIESEESKLEEFAVDLGRLLGTARGKAENWLNQRQTIVKNLTDLRDTASKLLADLGHQAQEAVPTVKRRGRPRKDESVVGVIQPAPVSRKKKRKMSPEARKRISDAQKARWAKQNAAKKK